MKLLITLTLLFILPANAEEELPFDNWLFEFFEGDSEMFGDIFGPNGESYDQAAGKMVTTIDNKNKKAVSTYTVRYKNLKTKTVSISTVTPKEKNTFSGSTKGPDGGITTYTLTLLDEKRYKSVAKWPNNQVVVGEGTLKNKNTIETTDLIKEADGTLLMKMKFTYKRAKKPKK